MHHSPPRRAPYGRLELVVEEGLDVVAVRITDESRVVAGAIVRAQARRAVVVRSSRLDGCAVESVDGGTIARSKGDVHRTGDRRTFLDPEVSATVGGEAERSLGALHDAESKGFNAAS